MSDDAAKQAIRLRFKRVLEELMEIRGMGTELVTVIIPPDRQVADVRHQLANESGQARNTSLPFIPTEQRGRTREKSLAN